MTITLILSHLLCPKSSDSDPPLSSRPARVGEMLVITNSSFPITGEGGGDYPHGLNS